MPHKQGKGMGLIMPIPTGLYEPGLAGTVPVAYIAGSAGTGKTYEVRRRIAENDSYGVLTATTGTSAMNLGTITLNSLLGYFDTESLEEIFFNGRLMFKLRELADEGYQNLVVDEISMLSDKQLDLIYQATKMLNEQRAIEGKPPLGIVLTGDFAQLSPVKAKWCFEAQCWPEFDAHTTRLTKIWRQADAKFIEAINAARTGNGPIAAALLQNCGVQFVRAADTHFDGTTIMAKNKAVDNFNWLCHSRLAGVPICVRSTRWGEQKREWGQIPIDLQLKPNSYVVILSNDTPLFSYVNGDCGHVRGYEDGCFQIELVRNGSIVDISLIERRYEQRNPPDILLSRHAGLAEGDLRQQYRDSQSGEPFWDPDKRRWVLGAVRYYPLRLAWASTIHRSQGLSLDRVQFDCNDHFAGNPNMCYVAISRCRSAEGLRIVGSPHLLASRVNVDPLVARWL